MEIEKSISVVLTPDEVRDIIKTHLFKNKNINVDSVYFNIELKYDGYDDQHGSHLLTKIECEGILDND